MNKKFFSEMDLAVLDAVDTLWESRKKNFSLLDIYELFSYEFCARNPYEKIKKEIYDSVVFLGNMHAEAKDRNGTLLKGYMIDVYRYDDGEHGVVFLFNGKPFGLCIRELVYGHSAE